MTTRRCLSALAVMILWAPAAPGALIFDSLSNSTTVNVGTAPNTFMGQAVTLGGGFETFAIGTPGTLSITAGVVNTTGSTLTTALRMNVWLWDTHVGGSPTGVFEDQIGGGPAPTAVFDFGLVPLLNNTFSDATVVIPSIALNPSDGQTLGITINWQLDSGGGNFVTTTGLTSAIRGGGTNPPPAVGAFAVGLAPTFGYYRNASGETNGNFLGTSARNIGNNSGMRLQLDFVIPEPATGALALAGLGLLARRRR